MIKNKYNFFYSKGYLFTLSVYYYWENVFIMVVYQLRESLQVYDIAIENCYTFTMFKPDDKTVKSKEIFGAVIINM